MAATSTAAVSSAVANNQAMLLDNDVSDINMPVIPICLTPQQIRRTQSYSYVNSPVIPASFQPSNIHSSQNHVVTIQLHRTTPIGKHYALQEQLCQALDHELSILQSSNNCNDNNNNDSNNNNAKKKGYYERAYAIGGQSVDLAVTVLPQHGYYYSMRHFQERQQSLASASRVLQQLETLILPHLVHLEKGHQEHENRRTLQVDQWKHQLRQLLLHQQDQLQQQVGVPSMSHSDTARKDRVAAPLVRPSSPHETTSIRTTTTFYERLLDCGESMTTVMCPNSTISWEDEDHRPIRTSGSGRRKRNHRLATVQEQQQQTSFRNHSDPIPLHSRSQTAPAKLYPAQSQYHGYHPQHQPISLDRGLFFTRLDQYSSQQQQQQGPTTSTAMCMSTPISNTNGAVSQEAVLSASSTSSLASDSCMVQLCKRYDTEFQSLQQKQRIHILPLDTYQGKYAGSVNGCALIAPLLCIKHLKKQHNTNDNHNPNVNGHEDQTVSSMSRLVGTDDPVTFLKSRTRTLSPTSRLYSSKEKDKTKRRSKRKGRRFPCSKQVKSSSYDDNDTSLLTCNNDNEWLDDGVSNDAIVRVINVETPAILPKIRDKLGLVKDALIVPSDVHDYLLDRGNHKDENDDPKDENGRLNDGGGGTRQNNSVLAQEDFVTVCGGNVMDPQHLGQLIDALSSFDNVDNHNNNNNHNSVDPKEQQRLRKRKLAATFFFHEHVICIHRLWRGNNVVWYDVIDSLPCDPKLYHATSLLNGRDHSFAGNNTDNSRGSHLLDHNGALSTRNGYGSRMIDVAAAGGSREVPLSIWSHENDSIRDSHDHYSSSADYDHDDEMGTAIRIRCHGASSLEATLQWYACSKFTPANRSYIDNYEWQDSNSDFDPRVFQAFVWTDGRQYLS